jgi:N-acetylmuramoyl-L-alanine amidase
MKKILIFLLLAAFLWGCTPKMPESAVTEIQTEPVETMQEITEAPTEVTFPETTAETLPPIVLDLSEEDRQLLLQIGMAELGQEGCRECIALVMCTVLNRVNSSRFGSTVRGVLYAQDQFTPVMDGTFETVRPNEACYEALDMVLRGWDESKGALFYEFCEGPSWHSRNLKLLTEHCNTRFYQ